MYGTSNVMTLLNAQNAIAAYETPRQLFRIDRFIPTRIATWHCDLIGEEDPSTRHGPTVSVETGPRHMGHDN